MTMQNNDLNLNQFLKEMFAVGLKPIVLTDPDDMSPIEELFNFVKDQDGVWTLTTKGKTLGWVNRVAGDVKYRALSNVTYQIEYFYSLENARNFLFEQSH